MTAERQDGGALAARVGAALDRTLPLEVEALARELAQANRAEAVLFYGSNLRTGSLDGVLDFYVLTSGHPERGIWPRVSWVERTVGGRRVHAKVATMAFATFDLAARGRLLDTTVWARFVQPSALAWVRDGTARVLVSGALASAARTAATLAAALGPECGNEGEYWRALFRATYAAELRVERPGREDTILAAAPAHFAGLLARAWTSAGIGFAEDNDMLQPLLPAERRAAILRWWRMRRLAGRPLNLGRLARATVTFDGAARYGAWKIERHTGEPVPIPDAADRHPLLAVPALARALWRVRRKAPRGSAG